MGGKKFSAVEVLGTEPTDTLTERYIASATAAGSEVPG